MVLLTKKKFCGIILESIMMVAPVKQSSNMEKISSIVVDHGKTLRKWDLREEIIIDIELAMEEVLANIVLHGYENQSIDVRSEVHIDLTRTNEYVELTISDRGSFFDINCHNEINLGSYLNSPVNGGFGASLIKKVMTEIQCLRKNGTNITILRKRI